MVEGDDYVCQCWRVRPARQFRKCLSDARRFFVVPRVRKGKKRPSNPVACSTPSNTIKGTRVYAGFDEAKAFVLAQREQFRKSWEAKTARPMAKTAKA